MKVDRAVIHAFFECQTCQLQWGYYVTAEELAREHTKETKHVTNGEIGTSVIVYP